MGECKNGQELEYEWEIIQNSEQDGDYLGNCNIFKSKQIEKKKKM